MDRRSFINFTVASAATGIIAPNTVLAGTLKHEISNNELAGSVFYTKDSRGRWKKKAGPHSPILKRTGSGIQVVTGHPMITNKHWIVKHVLLDNQYKFIAEHIFNPETDKIAISNFELNNQKGAVYALSVCNLHDTWLSVLEG